MECPPSPYLLHVSQISSFSPKFLHLGAISSRFYAFPDFNSKHKSPEAVTCKITPEVHQVFWQGYCTHFNLHGTCCRIPKCMSNFRCLNWTSLHCFLCQTFIFLLLHLSYLIVWPSSLKGIQRLNFWHRVLAKGFIILTPPPPVPWKAKNHTSALQHSAFLNQYIMIEIREDFRVLPRPTTS